MLFVIHHRTFSGNQHKQLRAIPAEPETGCKPRGPRVTSPQDGATHFIFQSGPTLVYREPASVRMHNGGRFRQCVFQNITMVLFRGR